jgi:hypothetical protein
MICCDPLDSQSRVIVDSRSMRPVDEFQLSAYQTSRKFLSQHPIDRETISSSARRPLMSPMANRSCEGLAETPDARIMACRLSHLTK